MENNSIPEYILEQKSSKQQTLVSIAVLVLFILVAKDKMK